MNGSNLIMGLEDGLICSHSSAAAAVVAPKSWHQPGYAECNMWNNCIELNMCLNNAGKSKRLSCIVSSDQIADNNLCSRRPSGLQKKGRALKEAGKFTSKFPFFKILMGSTYVTGGPVVSYEPCIFIEQKGTIYAITLPDVCS